VSLDAPTPVGADRAEALLSLEFLRKLEHLTLVLTKAYAGRIQGERRSTRRGSSVEFADFRNYTHGDDLRYVDWNVYARLEKLFLKLYVAEEDLHLHLLIDASQSMAFGSPDKLRSAQRLAAAMGYIALCGLDRLSVTAITDRLGSRRRDLRGRGNTGALFSWLQGMKAGGATDFRRVLSDYALLAGTPGMAIIISDFLAPGLEEGIRALVGRKFLVTLVQVLAPEEISPAITGDLRLVDAETGETREITVTSGLLARYQQRLLAHQQYLENLAHRYGLNYVRMRTDEPFEELILRYMRARRVVE